MNDQNSEFHDGKNPYGQPPVDPRMAAYQSYRARTPQYNERGKKIGNGLGTASLVLGILALLFFLTGLNFLFAVIAVILGIIQLVSYDKKGFAVSGIVCAVLSVGLTIGSYAAILSNEALTAMIQESVEDGSLLDEMQEYLLQMDGLELIPQEQLL